MTDPENVTRPQTTEEAADIVTHDDALSKATDKNAPDDDAKVNEETPEPTD